MENVGIFYRHLEYFTANLNILWPFDNVVVIWYILVHCIKESLATLSFPYFCQRNIWVISCNRYVRFASNQTELYWKYQTQTLVGFDLASWYRPCLPPRRLELWVARSYPARVYLGWELLKNSTAIETWSYTYLLLPHMYDHHFYICNTDLV
jgi:hypothetical protein